MKSSLVKLTFSALLVLGLVACNEETSFKSSTSANTPTSASDADQNEGGAANPEIESSVANANGDGAESTDGSGSSEQPASDGTGGDAPGTSDPAGGDPAPTSDPTTNTGTSTPTTTATPSGDIDEAKCAAILGGNLADVVKLSQSSVDLVLQQNSIIFLDLTGQAMVNLASTTVTAIKGICIRSTGESNVNIDISFTIGAMYYYGRGSAVTNIAFKSGGKLNSLSHDISGGQSVNITGENLDCDALKLSSKGSAIVTCNGKQS